MRRPLLITTLVTIVVALACSPEESKKGAPAAPSNTAGAAGSGGGSNNVCTAEPEEGCPCATVGDTVECIATRDAGSYHSCSTGTRTCGENNKWGKCIGDSAWDGGT